MKKAVLIFVLFCVSSICFSQIHEAGIVAGGSTFVGDIGATNYIKPNDFALGILYKYNLNPRMALRGNFTHFRIKGNDLDSNNSMRRLRGLTFNNNISMLAAGMEYNFFEYDLSKERMTSTPYILAQIAAYGYKAAGDNKLTFSPTIPIGIGYKSQLYRKLAFSVEATVQYAFSDDLDSANITDGSNDWFLFTGFSIVYTFGRPSCYNQR